MMEIICVLLTIYSIYISIKYNKASELLNEYKDHSDKLMDFINKNHRK